MPEPEQSLQLDFLGDLRRTHTCGQLRREDAGKRALVMGWVHRRRDLGKVIFIHLRDRDGVTQIVFNEGLNSDVHDRAEQIALGVRGRGRRHASKLRTPDTINPDDPDGRGRDQSPSASGY